MIRSFVLSRGQGGYVGTVKQRTGHVVLLPDRDPEPVKQLKYRTVGACYEALCGKPDGYLWRTLEHD